MDESRERERAEDYESLFIRLSARMERLLIRLAITALILLLVSQAVLQIPAARHWLVKAERLEGIPFYQKKFENQD